MVMCLGPNCYSKRETLIFGIPKASELVSQMAIFDDSKLKKILGGSPIRLNRFRSPKRSRKYSKVAKSRSNEEILCWNTFLKTSPPVSPRPARQAECHASYTGGVLRTDVHVREADGDDFAS